MKPSTIIPVLFIFIFATQAYSGTSSRLVLSCDQAKVEDICWDNAATTRCRRQVVIFGEHAKGYFYDHRMLYPNFKMEFIIPELQSILNSPDYKDESQAYSSAGRVLYVKPNLVGDNSLTVESFATSQPTGGLYVQKNFVGSYNFLNCTVSR